MTNASQLKIGYIPYLNCVPFFHYLAEAGCSGRLIPGVPSVLNQMLQMSELDVSPSSSFEYARNWRDYLLLPGHSISSIGPVKSVLLFSPCPLEKLSREKISITGDSATSINLLRIVLREFVGIDEVVDEVPHGKVEDMIASGSPALLIGDRALRAAANLPHGIEVFDLGELWYQHTGLPFVFALWMIRKDSVSDHEEEFDSLGSQLTLSRNRFFSELEKVAENICQESYLTIEEKIKYWETIDYRLDDKHIEGLQLFFDLCIKYALLDESPQIEFYKQLKKT